jgi:hypothetical protein
MLIADVHASAPLFLINLYPIQDKERLRQTNNAFNHQTKKYTWAVHAKDAYVIDALNSKKMKRTLQACV